MLVCCSLSETHRRGANHSPSSMPTNSRKREFAEELGYDEIWLTEHHFAEDGYSPAILPIASAIGAITKRIRIGTYLVLLPLHNAVRVAEDAATIDIISGGRFDLGVGQGYAPGEFAAYGVNRKARASRLEEGIEVIRGAWTTDDFSYEGRHYKVKNIRLMPRPVQSPHPPLWIGAGAPKAIERAGRMGCHFMGLADPGSQKIYDASFNKRDAIRRISPPHNFTSPSSGAPTTRRGRIRRNISIT